MKCIRCDEFHEENHPCFIEGCVAYCHPLESKTCEICNFKKCSNGHCGCDLTKEARFAVDKLYDTFCDYCGGQQIIWIYDGIRINWKPKRTPKLGWNEVTLLEALADSAKTSLCIQEKKTVPSFHTTKTSLNKLLTILRAKIEKSKIKNTLLKTCEYRETTRTRCNKYPTTLIQGKWVCKEHELESEDCDCNGVGCIMCRDNDNFDGKQYKEEGE